MAPQKKFFDVAHPNEAGPSVQIAQRKRIVIDDVQERTLAESQDAQPDVTPPKATPPPESANESQEGVQAPQEEVRIEPLATEEPTLVQDEAAIEPPVEQEAPAPTTTDLSPSVQETTISGAAVSDAVPDISQTMTAKAEETMQHPKAFDTTEYFVPIATTTHKHGHLVESLIFGAIFAIVVVGAVVYFLGR